MMTTTRTHRPYFIPRDLPRIIGRTPTLRERVIISILEHTPKGRPLLLIDPPGVSSCRIILDYLRYRLHHSPIDTALAVIRPTPRRIPPYLTPLLTSLPRKPHPLKRITLFNPLRPDKLRGLTAPFIFLPHIETYGSASPFRRPIPEGFYNLAAALFPISSPAGLIILHLSLPTQKARRRRRPFPLDIPTLPLPATAPLLPQYRHTLVPTPAARADTGREAGRRPPCHRAKNRTPLTRCRHDFGAKAGRWPRQSYETPRRVAERQRVGSESQQNKKVLRRCTNRDVLPAHRPLHGNAFLPLAA